MLVISTTTLISPKSAIITPSQTLCVAIASDISDISVMIGQVFTLGEYMCIRYLYKTHILFCMKTTIAW